MRLQASFDSSPGGAGFLTAEGGDKDVKIILGQRGAHVPDSSLVGRQLPSLADFKVKLNPDETRNKMILVCFWDMHQRPSRHCIRQLAQHASQLKEKGIVVVAVQATNVDEKALNDWLKKSKILFPVGAVQGDEKKTKATWGTQSLPWLILTDRNYIVRAEGFRLNELDKRLREITKIDQ